MPFNFYDTHTLLMAVQQLTPAATFLRDRYFPTNDASDIFATDDVLVEFRDGSKKLAPFVAPRKGGVTVLRAGYNMERYTPPFVAPRRVLTLDELRKRGFGEALYSQLTPEQRQQTLILRDADELEARLVKEGVAKYIGEQDETAEQPAPDHGDDADEPASTNTAADEAPEYNEDMKLDELKEAATRYGVDASAMRKKADVIAAIEATKAEQPDDGADAEEPPQIGAADPVGLRADRSGRRRPAPECPRHQDPALLLSVGSRLPRARHLQAEGRRQRHLHPAIQRGGGLLLREERRGLA